jgi:hypothetical protein
VPHRTNLSRDRPNAGCFSDYFASIGLVVISAKFFDRRDNKSRNLPVDALGRAA